MKVRKLALLAGVLACSGAMADTFSYRYAEVAYFNQTDHADGVVGNDKIESDGYSGVISLDFNGVLIQLNHTEGDINRIFGTDPGDLDLDLKVKSTGVFFGGHGEANAKTSFYGGIGFERSRLDTNVGDIDTNVWRFGGGVRYWVIPKVELNAQIFFLHASSAEDDDDSSDNDGRLGVGVRFQPVDMVSVGANYYRLVDAESDAYTIDARFQF